MSLFNQANQAYLDSLPNIEQKIRIIKRERLDGTFTVIRVVLENKNQGKGSFVVEQDEFPYKTKSHATRKFNQLIAEAPSCEFVIDKDVSAQNELNIQVLETGEVFNTSETLWFCVGKVFPTENENEAVGVANGNAKADVGNANEAPPPSNTGGLNEKQEAGTEIDVSNPPYCLFGDIEADLAKLQISEQYAMKVMEHGQLKTIMLRRGLNSPAFIDTISFTVQESAFRDLDDDLKQKSSFDCVMEAIVQVSQCMGFKPVLEISGRNGYTNGLQFGDKEQQRNFGFVCWGGTNQQETIMFHFTGEGLSYARQD